MTGIFVKAEPSPVKLPVKRFSPVKTVFAEIVWVGTEFGGEIVNLGLEYPLPAAPTTMAMIEPFWVMASNRAPVPVGSVTVTDGLPTYRLPPSVTATLVIKPDVTFAVAVACLEVSGRISLTVFS